MSDSAASSQVPTAPSRVKYRSSCDRCSGNKIKCGQEQPTCQRCRSLNQQCHYSRSMRSGKPPRSRQKMTAMARSHQSLRAESYQNSIGQLSTSTDDATVVPRGSAAAMPLPSLLPVPVSSLNGMMETMLAANASHTGVSPFGMLYEEDSPLETSEKYTINTPMDYASNQGYIKPGDTPINQHHTTMALLPSPIMSQTVDNPIVEQKQQVPYMSPCSNFQKPSTMETEFSPMSPAFGKPLGITSNPSHDCIGLALGTLGSLYQLSSPQISVWAPTVEKISSESAPTVDQVLHVNNLALKNTAILVRCPCPRDYHFQMLIAVIYLKILTWYQAIVNIDDPGVEAVNGMHSPSRESVVHRPLSVGAYKVDEEMGKSMTYQLVLCELREMARSVKVFVEGMDPGMVSSSRNGNGNSTMASRGAAGGEHITHRMGSVLDSRLQYTIHQLENMPPP